MNANKKPRLAGRGNPNEALLSFICTEYSQKNDFAILKKIVYGNHNPLVQKLAAIKLRQISLEGRCP